MRPFRASFCSAFNAVVASSSSSRSSISWLNLIRDHIATAISIEPEDLEPLPFNQRGGLGKAHQLFGAELPNLLDELNNVLAA
jgi:type I restriction enzyme R subunit